MAYNFRYHIIIFKLIGHFIAFILPYKIILKVWFQHIKWCTCIYYSLNSVESLFQTSLSSKSNYHWVSLQNSTIDTRMSSQILVTKWPYPKCFMKIWTKAPTSLLTNCFTIICFARSPYNTTVCYFTLHFCLQFKS